MPKLIIRGTASNKIIYESEISEIDLNENALNYLRKLKIPIASSCNGEGVCRKCIVNKNMLSCEKILGEFKYNNVILIEISYL